MSESGNFPKRFMPALFHPWVWRMAWRDSRSQRTRLVVFSLAVVAGIAALVAIHSLKASARKGIDSQAKSLLGSDLRISSRQPFGEGQVARLVGMAEESSREITFPSMLKFVASGAAKLVQVRGIEGGYPYYGKVETRPAEAWAELGMTSGILLEPALLDQFQAKIGDEVELGGSRLRIAGVVDKPAPRGGRFSSFSPEVYLNLEEVERTGLLEGNSMSSHELHFRLSGEGESREMKDELRAEFPNEPWRIETPEDRRERLGDALEQTEGFLGIVALASLALGAIGVAGAVHAHIRRRVASVAVLRCLGCPGPVAAAVYFAQAGALGLFGALLGAGLGVLLQVGVLTAFRGSLPLEVAPSPEWAAVAMTTLAGFAVCCAFALIPLSRVRRISPAETLREATGPAGASLRDLPLYLLPVVCLVLPALASGPDWKPALVLVGGLAAAFAVLVAVARGLMFLTRRLVGRNWPYLLRQGISNLHRPGNQTLLFLLSLGLGTFLLVTILLAGRQLNERLEITRSAESPNLYLIDVQPDQVEGVEGLLEKQGLPVLESAPMVTMRIAAVRGRPLREIESIPRWVARREFRSTYRGAMNATESLVAGVWHEGIEDPGGPVPLSLEEEIAKDLGVGIGDAMTLDVQGVPVEVRVTSLRKVDWSKFNLNFFMVFPPGVLEEAPGFNVVTTRTPTPEASGRLQRELVAGFANVSAIDLSQILELVSEIVGKISLVVSVLAGFTVLAGLPILAGTLMNGRDVRVRESVLLRTLGASAGQLRTLLVIEYATLGFLSSLTGVLLAVAASAGLAVYVFKASPVPDPEVLIAAIVIVTAISVIGGMLLSRGVCHHPPMEGLREV